MERESGRLSALHLVEQLKNQLDQLTSQTNSDESDQQSPISSGDINENRSQSSELRDHEEVYA